MKICQLKSVLYLVRGARQTKSNQLFAINNEFKIFLFEVFSCFYFGLIILLFTI